MSNINSYKSIVQVKKLLKVNDSRFEDRLNYLISEQAKLKQSIWPLGSRIKLFK
jgi:LytS/YehU family sensor histidine kinase